MSKNYSHNDKMADFSKTGSINMAEIRAIDFSYPASYLTLRSGVRRCRENNGVLAEVQF